MLVIERILSCLNPFSVNLLVSPSVPVKAFIGTSSSTSRGSRRSKAVHDASGQSNADKERLRRQWADGLSAMLVIMATGPRELTPNQKPNQRLRSWSWSQHSSSYAMEDGVSFRSVRYSSMSTRSSKRVVPRVRVARIASASKIADGIVHGDLWYCVNGNVEVLVGTDAPPRSIIWLTMSDSWRVT
jgi:hypothetical protein